MKYGILICVFVFAFEPLLAQQAKSLPARQTTVAKKNNEVKDNTRIQKSPKAIFLIKRAKVDADIGEPVLYPFERQLSNIYYDLPGGVIRND